MARQGRVRPKRKGRDLEALLLESAESLGRIIGSLQQELEDLGRPASNPDDGRAPAKRAPTSPSRAGTRTRGANTAGGAKGAKGPKSAKGAARGTAMTARSATGGGRGGRKAARRTRSR